MSTFRYGLILMICSLSAPAADLPDPNQFLKGVPGAIAGMIGGFKAVRRADGSVHIVGRAGFTDQVVRPIGNGQWEQVGDLRTPLPCAQAIHNLVTRKRTH